MLLDISISDLLENLQGDVESVPPTIQTLYGKLYIFQFKLNDKNLTEGRQGYLVRKTFIPDDKIEEKIMMDKDNKVSNNIYGANMVNLIYNDIYGENSVNLFCNIATCF
jgi:hypothetical protein